VQRAVDPHEPAWRTHPHAHARAHARACSQNTHYAKRSERARGEYRDRRAGRCTP
jgi:hypothetical protein